MNYQVAVLSPDAEFARMLEIECRFCQWNVLRAPQMESRDRASVILLDLDSVISFPQEKCGYIIGFTRRSAQAEDDSRRRCSMILHRPFEIRLLRQEISNLLSGGTANEAETKTGQPVLLPEQSALRCGEREIFFSPTEYRMMQCLLERRGEPVSRKTLTGSMAGNKTEVYICGLRRKLAASETGLFIETVRGKGYRIP